MKNNIGREEQHLYFKNLLDKVEGTEENKKDHKGQKEQKDEEEEKRQEKDTIE